MALGKFIFTGNLPAYDETPKQGTVRVIGKPAVVVDTDGNKDYTAPGKPIPFTGSFDIELVTDVTEGESAAIGYRVIVTPYDAATITVEFWAQPAGSTLDLSDVTTQVVDPPTPTAASATQVAALETRTTDLETTVATKADAGDVPTTAAEVGAEPAGTVAALDAELAPVAKSGSMADLSGQASDAQLPARLGADALGAAFVSATRARQVALVGGRFVAWLGDSHLDGAGASNAGNTSIRAVVPRIAGQDKVAGVTGTIDAAVGGDSSANVLARTPGVLAQNPQMAFLMCGSGDANNAVPLADYKANVAAIVDLCQEAGVPVAIGTPPPQASAKGATLTGRIREQVLWLKLWAPTVGVPLADVFSAVVDTTTGYLAAGYDYGDGIHLNDAGHQAAANVVAPVLAALSTGDTPPAYPWLVTAPAPAGAEYTGLVSNPLMAGAAGGLPTSWLDWAGVGGRVPNAGVSFSTSAKDGRLPVGQWGNMRLDGPTAGAGGIRVMARSLTASGFTAGDQLLFVTYAKSTQIVGAGFAYKLFNGSTGAALTSNDTFGTVAPGALLKTYPVGAGVTSILAGMLGTITAAQDITFSLGATDVFNLTRMGLTEFAF